MHVAVHCSPCTESTLYAVSKYISRCSPVPDETTTTPACRTYWTFHRITRHCISYFLFYSIYFISSSITQALLCPSGPRSRDTNDSHASSQDSTQAASRALKPGLMKIGSGMRFCISASASQSRSQSVDRDQSSISGHTRSRDSAFV